MSADGPVLIRPDWPAPARVRAVSTTRLGGVSRGPYASLNLGARGADDPARVAENRTRVAAATGCPPPAWLDQVHGTAVARPARADAGEPRADAATADRPGVACVVLTADCLPVLLCDRGGHRVAAAHAGWRGLAAGVVEATVAANRPRFRGHFEQLSQLQICDDEIAILCHRQIHGNSDLAASDGFGLALGNPVDIPSRGVTHQNFSRVANRNTARSVQWRSVFARALE